MPPFQGMTQDKLVDAVMGIVFYH